MPSQVFVSNKELKLTGTVSAESLRDLLARRVDKLDNIEVALDEEGVHATAQAKIFGRKADILLEGKIGRCANFVNGELWGSMTTHQKTTIQTVK